MEKKIKTKSKISPYVIGSAAYAVSFLFASVALSSASNGANRLAKASASPRVLTFAQRVAYQRAIEEVYWHHRIWPKENANPKPSLDAVTSHAQIERKVEDYLRESQTLADYWEQAITADQLQAEMDRMAQHTKQPEVLCELFEVAGERSVCHRGMFCPALVSS